MSEEYLKLIDVAVESIKGHLKQENNIKGYEEIELGIICGSGLGDLGKRLIDPVEIEYENIPGFPLSTVVGHHGKLIFGLMEGISTVCMVGRIHFYEGYDLKQVTLPVRIMSKLGVNTLLVTNAAGGVDNSFSIGDVMAIEDHISFMNMSGLNPLFGPNLNDFGTRFPSMTRIYLKNTFELIKEAAEMAGFGSEFIKKGIYCAVSGPSFETPAEIRLIRLLGGSAVGMSTAPEVTIAAHSGIKRILGFSMISNKCVDDNDNRMGPCHEEVLETSEMRIRQLEIIVGNLVKLLYQK